MLVSKKMKRLAKAEDAPATTIGPFTEDEIDARHSEYESESPAQFRKKYRTYAFKPAAVCIGNGRYLIQYNFCPNPFCHWYGLPQKKYENIKSKPSRYKFSSTIGSEESDLFCNPIIDNSYEGAPLAHSSKLISNWSVAEEISRLVRINTVVPVDEDYVFHRSNCKDGLTNPFDSPKSFYKRGKSTAGSQKYQCTTCGKMTNVLPTIAESYNYHQKQNIILHDLLKDIFARTPVRRTCEKLNISPCTYYAKLEYIYRRCLEFLEYRETNPLKEKEFQELYLNTDAMVYYLNNVRRKGMSNGRAPSSIEKKMKTHIITSADSKSGYVFRSDIAFDWEFGFTKLDEDTEMYHCDHDYAYLRKNDRLKHSFFPQPPTDYDDEDYSDYEKSMDSIIARQRYVRGFHVKSNYTATAHYWLVRNALNVDRWYFSSDDDTMLQLAIFRVFVSEFSSKTSHYFTCQNDKSLSLSEAVKQFHETRNMLNEWAFDWGYGGLSTTQKARLWYEDFLSDYDLYDYTTINGISYPIPKKTPFLSPLSTKDEGARWINCITDTRGISNEELAGILVNIGNWATNNYYQELRRRVSLLERPLVTSRGDGKSYIYANYNPRYAQYLVTIFRTLYNFCWTKKKGNEPERLTPAQRLGIADKAYDLKDIIYFK